MKILYSHTSTPTYIRCMKNITALTEAGHSVIFFGVQREGGPVYDADAFAGVSSLQVELYPHKFPHGLGSAIYLLRFLVALRCKIEEVKPDVVLLTNEELMLATLFLDKQYGPQKMKHETQCKPSILLPTAQSTNSETQYLSMLRLAYDKYAGRVDQKCSIHYTQKSVSKLRQKETFKCF